MCASCWSGARDELLFGVKRRVGCQVIVLSSWKNINMQCVDEVLYFICVREKTEVRVPTVRRI